MYENRVTAFIDILGFRNIITNTTKNNELQSKILDVLSSMSSDNIANELFGEISPEVPAEELEDVKRTVSLFAKAAKLESTIQVTHFSDSIVISVTTVNSMYVMCIFEFLGRLIYKLWNEFNILLRGAITMDDLIHIENGPLFGPAMVKAYDLETNLANYPRIIIDEITSNAIKNTDDYKYRMNKLFMDFEGERVIKDKIIKIDNGFEINLVSALNHLSDSHFAFSEQKKNEYELCVQNSPQILKELRDETELDNIKEKYQYLIELFKTDK
ncbi:hypothetical protein PG630_10385 [Riemerella anatipestifer]|nr:hypothetical protein [Riemerella anatipestifer]